MDRLTANEPHVHSLISPVLECCGFPKDLVYSNIDWSNKGNEIVAWLQLHRPVDTSCVLEFTVPTENKVLWWRYQISNEE